MRHTFMQAGIVTGLVCQVLVANAAITGWRNDGTGKYLDANSLTTWSRTNSVIWKTPLPKHSNASPAIVGKRIFVCQEHETLTCLSTQDDSINWNRTVDWTTFADTKATPKRPNAHDVNGYLTPTPLTDGKHVYVVFGSGVAAAFDMKGNQLWARLVSSDSGDMVLITPGRTYQEFVRNKLEPFRSCPTFSKGRIYVRTLNISTA